MARRIGIKTAASNGDIALWEPLYTLADQVFALEPWLFHPEEDLFGVQNPATGAISYVCVMGGIGTHCALALYRGTNGLNGLLKMRAMGDPEQYDSSEILSWQDCLMLSFENRDEVSEKQRARIKALGRSYRGHGNWPHFQEFVPYRFPWEVDDAGREWLKVALEQALNVLRRSQNDLLLIPEVEPLGPHLVRVQRQDGAWEDALLPIAPRTTLGLHPARVESALVAKLAEKGRVTQRLELGSIPFPEPMQESPESAPFFITALLLVEPDTGMVLGHALARHEALPTEAQALLVQALQNHEILPSELAVSDLTLARLVKPLTDALEIPLEIYEELPGFEAAAESLLGHVGLF